MRHRISPAMLIASVALFISLGGAASAATGYRITSIWQIKPSVRHALRAHRGPRGAEGPKGAAGAVGAPGPSGTIDWTRTYFREGGQSCCGVAGQPLTSSDPGARLIQSCDAGDRVIQGGFEGNNEIVTASELVAAVPWEYEVDAHLDPNAVSPIPGRAPQGFAEAWVLCAPGPGR